MPLQITGTIVDHAGNAWKSREVIIVSTSTPLLSGSSIVATSRQTFVTKSDGTIPLITAEGGPIYLLPGNYEVKLGNNEEGGTFTLAVIDTIGTVDWSTLISGPSLIFETSLFQSGDGSPEGVNTARRGARYWDYTNRIDYVKDSGSGNTGWLALVTLP